MRGGGATGPRPCASTVEIDTCLANLELPIPAELWCALKADAMLAAEAPTP